MDPSEPYFSTPADRARFNSKWIKVGDCHIWQFADNGRGYGIFFLANKVKKNWQAHHVAWVNTYGPRPTGLVINHKCRVRGCVNPDHLEVVTRRVNNIKDSSSPAALNFAKTVCKNGHPFDRIKITKRGPFRVCSICATAYNKKLWADKPNKKGRLKRRPNCKNGHPFDRVYLINKGKPVRYCSICVSAKKKRLRAKWAEERRLKLRTNFGS